MEHYDWNEGWLFTPTFDPALVRPECPELSRHCARCRYGQASAL